jgi:hypothetical protein
MQDELLCAAKLEECDKHCDVRLNQERQNTGKVLCAVLAQTMGGDVMLVGMAVWAYTPNETSHPCQHTHS